MEEIPRRPVLQALAAAGAGTAFTSTASATEQSETSSDFHQSFDRPDISVVNNSSETSQISLALETESGESVFDVEETLSGVGALAASNSLETADPKEFTTKLDFPERVQTAFEGENLPLQVTVDGERETEVTVGFGTNGFPEYGTVHVDVRDEQVKTEYSEV